MGNTSKPKKVRWFRNPEYWIKKGKTKYIIYYGCGWGLLTVLIMSLMNSIPMLNIHEEDKSFSEVFLSRQFIIQLLIFTFIAGPIFGWFNWKSLVNKYEYRKKQKLKKEKESEEKNIPNQKSAISKII